LNRSTAAFRCATSACAKSCSRSTSFPKLITTQIDLRPINDLAPGAQLELRLPLTVNLHGQQHTYNTELLATRLDDRRFQVVTLEPVVINAEDFDLAPAWKRCASSPGCRRSACRCRWVRS
jgi:hypothetical protein